MFNAVRRGAAPSMKSQSGFTSFEVGGGLRTAILIGQSSLGGASGGVLYRSRGAACSDARGAPGSALPHEKRRLAESDLYVTGGGAMRVDGRASVWAIAGETAATPKVECSVTWRGPINNLDQVSCHSSCAAGCARRS